MKNLLDWTIGLSKLADHSQQLIHAALLETLDSVVTPDVRQGVLRDALSEVAGGELPDDVYGFRRFVQGPLREALVRVLGPSLADTVIRDLEIMGCSIPPTVRPGSVARRGSSDPLVEPVIPALPAPRGIGPFAEPRSRSPVPIRRSSSPGPRRGLGNRTGTPMPRGAPGAAAPRGDDASDPLAQLAPMPPPDEVERPSSLRTIGVRAPHAAAFLTDPFVTALPLEVAAARPIVVAATRDPQVVATLTEWLGDRADLRVVTDILDLLAEANAERRVLVVVDCNRPSVRPVAVAALADELPCSTTVLLWAPSEDDETAIRTVAPQSASWQRCTAAAAAQLAIRCVELVS